MNAIVFGKNGKETLINVISKMTVPVALYKNNCASRTGWRKYNKNTGLFVTAMPCCDIGSKYIKWGSTGNKYEQRVALKEAGITVPYTSQYPSAFVKLPIIVRGRNHQGGSSFHLIENVMDVVNNNTLFTSYDNYFQDVINVKNEWRVHCAMGKVLSYQRKPDPPEGELRHNHSVNEEAFAYVNWDNYNPAVCKMALDATKALDRIYGAVDVYEDVNGNIGIFEVNACPSLSPYTTERYAKFFDWYFSNPDAQPFDYSTFTKGKSYAWKNEQLNQRPAV